MIFGILQYCINRVDKRKVFSMLLTHATPAAKGEQSRVALSVRASASSTERRSTLLSGSRIMRCMEVHAAFMGSYSQSSS